MVYFDARLSQQYPTVEIRSADVCPRIEDTVLTAALARAMVETAATEWAAGDLSRVRSALQVIRDEGIVWVGGATAYHQHHPAPDPPLQHLEAIVANANRFHRRWGWFPMENWLRQFADLGLTAQDPHTGCWQVVRPSGIDRHEG